MVRAAPPGGAAGGKCWPGIPTKTAQTYVKNATGDDALLPDVEESRGRSRILPPSFTPLMKAAAAGWDATVERLLAAANRDNRAALLFEQDHKGRTACDWARIRGRHAIEETLKAAMDDEQQQREAEREAVNQRHNLESLVRRNLRLRALLEHAVCKHDVHEAARAVRAANFLRDDYDEAVATLRRYADVISKSNNNNEEEPAETEPLQLDETLYFIDIETKTGDTPLLLACAAGNELLAEDLIRRGAAVDHENSRGHSALTWACVCGSDRVVDMLLRSGADPSRRTKIDGRTPLLHAAQQGHARVLQVLVDRLFYDAQMARHEALNGERKLPDKEIALVTRNWLLEFEKALKHTDPKTKLCARELAASMGNDAALAVLTTAELRCEARSAELEQEESLKEEVACPRGCGDARVRRDAMTSHLLNDCDLRPAGCDYCGATLPLRGLEQHKNKECPSRHIRCETCEKDVPASLWKVHRQFRCPKRMIKCRQGCDLVLSADQLSYHELTRCRYRGKPSNITSNTSVLDALWIVPWVVDKKSPSRKKITTSITFASKSAAGMDVGLGSARRHEGLCTSASSALDAECAALMVVTPKISRQTL
ncbi:hypothetical protein CTAYLR_002318 [Chrysophaeum taylorii]|uniref:TRAF-type domain-containing protein n=1 Tax=Chrysophaeum taylorii TaxID=2483200 RepID=A0AAD7UNS0_9STRA|nr:hypothetical protein CTAYLR_002318 [Chrysophaeum taylorii]